MSSSIKDDRVHRSTTASCSPYHCRQRQYVAHRVPLHNRDETLLYSWSGGLNAADVRDDIMMCCRLCSLCQMSVEKIWAALVNVLLSHFKSVNLGVILVWKHLYFQSEKGMVNEKHDTILYVSCIYCIFSCSPHQTHSVQTLIGWEVL